jgi:VCBS repeat-containing protein
LAPGATGTDQLKVVAYDSQGLASDVEAISVTVHGRNPPPTITSPTLTLAELSVMDDSTDTVATGTFTPMDAHPDDNTVNLDFYARTNDSGQTAADPVVVTTNTATQASIPSAPSTEITLTGHYGSFVLERNANGVVTWTYTLNEDDTDTNALAPGATGTDQLKVVAYDSNGLASDVEAISITVHGRNGPPTITLTTPASLNVNPGNLTATGTFAPNDVNPDDETADLNFYARTNDSGQTAADPVAVNTNTATQASIPSGTDLDNKITLTGHYGSFDLTRADNGTVTWTYTLNEEDPDTIALAAGATGTDQLKVVAYDALNAMSDVETISISVMNTVSETLFELPTATPVTGTTGADNALNGTTNAEVIQGDDQNDTIHSNGGEDIIIGGRGQDVIHLGNGAQTVIYRYESKPGGDMIAKDGADTIHNFEWGTDKIILVDENATNPVTSLTEFMAGGGVRFLWPDDNYTYFGFPVSGTVDGDPTSADAGSTLSIRYRSLSFDNLGITDPVAAFGGSSELKQLQYLPNFFGGMLEFAALSDLPDGFTIL